MEVTCTDAYVFIRTTSLPSNSEFVLTEGEKGITFVLREVYRDRQAVVYHAAPLFVLDPDYFQLNFKASIDKSDCDSFNLSLESDVGYQHVSKLYPQFAPKEGATTKSIYGSLALEEESSSLFGRIVSYFVAPVATGSEAAIELHFYENYEGV